MLVENMIIRPITDSQASISWTSDTASMRSWIFLNGRFSIGPFMADTKERTIILAIPEGTTCIVEIHDFDDDTVPASIQEQPLVQPTIGWNGVENATSYRIYHTIFDGGTMESLLCEVPPMSGRMEIDCPINLGNFSKRSNAERDTEAEGYRDATPVRCWHSFRVEAVDQFGNESENEVVAHFAADFPKPPEYSISHDTATGILTFRIQ